MYKHGGAAAAAATHCRGACRAQIASLCLKSANAVILKGGREAAHSNAAIVQSFQARPGAAVAARGAAAGD
jgi:gamma-glutamyl phosphate reductase